MQLLRETHIDFMKYRKFWIVVSLLLVALGVFAIANHTRLMNLGIDFAGGTQIKLRFGEHPQLDELRSLLAQQGMGEAEIQSLGGADANEVMVKTALSKGTEEGSRDKIVAALNRRYNQGQAGRADLNQIGADAGAQILLQADPERALAAVPTADSTAAEAARTRYQKIAEALLAERRKAVIFTSWDAVAKVPGLTPADLAALKQSSFLGDYASLGVENVGPQIGKELRQQGFWAVVLSLLGMLVYIWFRFELRFGIGAIMASLHDVLVTLGLFTLMRFEFNLTTIAAFLTLVGYSTCDTVVIFDRIREDMRKNRRRPLIEVMNEAINQTLSRTIMTGGLTLLTVAALLVLGRDVLRGFAFVMTVGIVVGTYSSIYVASPFALLWEQLFGPGGRFNRKAKAVRPGPQAVPPPAKPEAPRPMAPRPATR